MSTAQGKPGHKVLVVRPQRCIACHKCETACAFVHVGRFDPSRARLKVMDVAEEKGVPLVCLHCVDAACVKGCPTGALHRDESTGAVVYDNERCINCGTCLRSCPFGNIYKDPVSGMKLKCDLCGGEPACAVFCPTGAIAYEYPSRSADVVREEDEQARCG